MSNSILATGELGAEVATKSGGLSDSAKQNNGWVTADEVCFQHGFMRVRAELLVFLCSQCIAQNTALYQFSLANDAPQFPDAERDPVQRLNLSFATAIVVTAGSTFVSGRMAKLEKVFQKNGIHVIGMQDGRASNDGRLSGAHSEIFKAAGESTTESSREACRMLFFLLLRTPRECSPPIFACSIEDALHCNVVVCHAPHNHSAVEERNAFYESCSPHHTV